jgi:hypothetical protein
MLGLRTASTPEGKRREPPPRPRPLPHRSPTLEARTFEPKLVIVKGWCRYKDPERSLTQDEARDVGAKLLVEVGRDFRELVTFQDPLLQNSRLVFKAVSTEDAQKAKVMLSDFLNRKPFEIKGIQVFAMLEQSPERRERAAVIAKANAALEDAIGSSDHIRLDVRAGSSYYAPNTDNDRGLVLVGNYSATKKSWTWRSEALRQSWPTLDVKALQRDTEKAMQE